MKKYIHLFLICTFFIIGCNSADKNTEKTIMLTSKADLEAYVGQKITIIGKISNTKIPQILGIDIDYTGDTHTPKTGKATGILVKTIVPKDTSGIQKASRGAGTFYHLKSLDGDFTAKAILINK
ncbi:MAG: hypothetical protein AB8B65_02980 [Kordia sp.]|uniref:hypothetical protein n=1 Tax=Kordia sp. TaxID=1965332 RepID=UPI003857FF44